MIKAQKIETEVPNYEELNSLKVRNYSCKPFADCRTPLSFTGRWLAYNDSIQRVSDPIPTV
jgi:hypothetical protein